MAEPMMRRHCSTWRNDEKQVAQYSWNQDQRCPDRSCSHNRVSAGCGGRENEREIPVQPSCGPPAHATQTESQEDRAGGNSPIQEVAGQINKVSIRVAFRLERSGGSMLRWAVIFLVVAIVAGIFGFAGLMVAAAGIAKLLFYLFLILFLVSLIAGLARRT
jgi:uncharacterized membrane protein YtjA (UPF0391 family)